MTSPLTYCLNIIFNHQNFIPSLIGVIAIMTITVVIALLINKPDIQTRNFLLVMYLILLFIMIVLIVGNAFTLTQEAETGDPTPIPTVTPSQTTRSIDSILTTMTISPTTIVTTFPAQSNDVKTNQDPPPTTMPITTTIPATTTVIPTVPPTTITTSSMNTQTAVPTTTPTTQIPPAQIGLLVNNAKNLDNEETDSLNFARTNKFTIQPIDASQVNGNPQLLSQFQGYWAVSDSEPTAWKNPDVITSLNKELGSGKRLLMTSEGVYIGEYLGLGKTNVFPWSPSDHDEIYLVDYDNNEILNSLPTWKTGLYTNNASQELWHVVTPGDYNLYTLEGNGTGIPVTILYYLSEGYGLLTFPETDKKYNFNSTTSRALYPTVFLTEFSIGQGYVLEDDQTFTHAWRNKPLGERVLNNVLNWIIKRG